MTELAELDLGPWTLQLLVPVTDHLSKVSKLEKYWSVFVDQTTILA